MEQRELYNMFSAQTNVPVVPLSVNPQVLSHLLVNKCNQGAARIKSLYNGTVIQPSIDVSLLLDRPRSSRPKETNSLESPERVQRPPVRLRVSIVCGSPAASPPLV